MAKKGKTTVYQPNGVCSIEIELKNCKPSEINELRGKPITLLLHGAKLINANFYYSEQEMGARLQFLGDCR